MSNIFKIYINNNNNLTDLYLFIKNKYNNIDFTETIESLQSNYNNSKEFIKSDIFNNNFKDDFNDLDIKFILDFNINIYFVNDNIYYDDTLETVKFKFLKYYNFISDKINQLSYEELYMYGFINKKFNAAEIYNILSDFNSNKITNDGLKQYLININEQISIFNKLLENNQNKEKDIYNFDDLNQLDITEINILTPIGQNINNKLPHLYTTNPFHVDKISTYIKSIINISLNTNNSSLLFEYNLVNNTLFFCKFNDVLNYCKSKSPILEEDTFIKLYYPLIANNQIITREQFNLSKKTFLDKTNKHLSSNFFINKNLFIDNLNYINANNKNEFANLKYNTSGIKNIVFYIHTNINLSLNLESIFKIINSTHNIPFIKYNPGKKNENIYRLYCNKVSNNDIKIPYLSKESIIKHSKLIGKNNTISMVLNNNSTIKSFIIELDIYGSFNIKIDFNDYMQLDDINYYIKDNINHIIDIIKNTINDTNNILSFNSLFDNNIEIININYYINIESDLSIKRLKNIKNCLYYIFNIITDNTKEKIYRYKRVSNYNEMNDQDAFIIELIKQKELPIKIIESLKENFKITTIEEASKVFENALQTLDIVQNVFNYKRLKVKNSPGFIFKIDNKFANNINITIEKIDNIKYLDYMKLYIDSIFKLAFSDSTSDDFYQCNYNKSTSDTNNIFVDDIIPSEIDKQNIDINISNLTNILNDEIEIDVDNIIDSDGSDNSDDINNDLLDILLDDDDDNDDDDNDDDDDDEKDPVINEIDSDVTNPVYDLKTPRNVIFKNIDESQDENIGDDENKDDDEYDEDEDKDDDVDKNDDEDKDIGKTNPKDELDNDEKLKNFKESTRGNPILTKLEKYQPELFKVKTYKPNLAKEDINKNYVSYSRLCQAVRQPVILTEEEKNKVIEENPQYKNDILEYSSNTDQKYYYICPRFWDLKNNKPLTNEEVMSGKHGSIYNDNNGNIYKFEDRDREPRFLKDTVKDSKGNEFCLPCCFGKLKSGKAVTGNKTCDLKTNIVNKGDVKYVIRSDKFPLEQFKVGHLPLNIKKLFKFDSDNCINPANNNLKYDEKCILRYGVENSLNNSFLACIADVYSKEILKNLATISIIEMKDIIIKALTIDNFIGYNNGNLTQIFLTKKFDDDLLDKMNIDIEIHNSNFYEKLDKKNINHINLYKKIIIAYENFKLYLKGDNYIIDYNYLWDIICKPNKKLFPNGINLLILDITSYDLTDNVKVICPKQNFSNEFIDDSKKTLILLKKNEYFEPIYSIKSVVSDIINPLFSFNIQSDEINLKEFKKVLNLLKEDINNNCVIENRDKIFEVNTSLENIINILNKLKYEINYQIMDYENKIIAVIVSNNKFEGFLYIPCYPSNIDDDNIPIKFIDELEEIDFVDYNLTINLLNTIYVDSNEIIKCKPMYKIIDNELIIGILTNGNQYVMINKPELYILDNDIPEINDKNYIIADNTIQNSLKYDIERHNMINNIKLESGFYKSFKNTILKLLKQYKNYKFNIKIQDLIRDNAIIYFDKLKLIREELENLSQNHIHFAEYDKKILDNIKNLSICYNSNCDTNYCMIKSDSNVCNLIIPKLNLITNDDNYNIYYTKLADEFVRYNKTKLVLFNSSNFTLYNDIKYNINNDELVLIESVLVNQLVNSKLVFKDPYSNNMTFDYSNINYTKNIINKINTSNIKLKYGDYELDNKIQPGEKIKLKLPESQLEKYKELQKKTLNKSDKSKELEELEEIDINDINLDNNIEMSINQYTSTIKDNNYNCTPKKNVVKEPLIKLFKGKLHEFYFGLESEDKQLICSFELILFIIKHYNKIYKDLTIDTIKNDLIEEYYNYTNTQALLFFIKQHIKLKNMEPLINKISTKDFIKNQEFKNLLSTFINSPDYFITYIDLYLLAKKYDLPIILISTSPININIKLEPYIILNKNKNNNNYYFIKLPSEHIRGLNKKNYKLLYFEKSNIVFDIDNDLESEIETNIKTELSDYKDFIEITLENYNNKKIKNKK